MNHCSRHLAVSLLAGLAAVSLSAQNLELDVVRLGRDETQADIALGQFVAERRLRK